MSFCILCGGPDKNNRSLCIDCQVDLPWITTHCFQCARPLISSAKYCGECLQQSPPYHRTIALFNYDDLMARCVGLFKFHQHLVFGKIFGNLLSERLSVAYETDVLPQCILPMPLHPQRLKSRGFNQALELAYPIAKKLKLPIDIRSCHRIKPTMPQSQIQQVEARKKNVKNAFVIDEKFSYRHVAIVEDVMTTGATISAFTKALLKVEVERVDVWCCLRAT